MAASADAAADPVAAATACANLARCVIELAPTSPVAKKESTLPYRLKVPAPLVNVNVPPGSGWPVVATRLGLRLYEDLVEFRRDPRGREYLWIGGGGVRHEDLAGSDTEAQDRGAISVTPLLLDLSSSEGSALAQKLVLAASSLSVAPR
jgi:5'-nucleotidase